MLNYCSTKKGVCFLGQIEELLLLFWLEEYLNIPPPFCSHIKAKRVTHKSHHFWPFKKAGELGIIQLLAITTLNLHMHMH